MPIYEYKCDKCGVFEVTQRITEPTLKRCPTCKGKVERMISATSFILKGSGWYATDYAKSGSAKSDSSSDSSGSNGTTGDAKSGDSKSSDAKSSDSSTSESASKSKASSEKSTGKPAD